MPYFTGILFALVSLAAIICKSTARIDNNVGNYHNSYNALNTFDYNGKVAKVSRNNNIYYIQLLVFVDYDLYLAYGNKDKVREYVMTFWKGVDVIFQNLKTLKISISIADIIIAESRSDIPYLAKNTRGNQIAYNDALTDMGKHLYHEKNLPLYDIAVQMTRLDLCEDWITPCTPYIKGSTNAGGACMVNDILEEVKSVLIIKDSGGYNNIISTAHEMSHILGSPHDGEESYYFPQTPGSTNCPPAEGYIMGKFNGRNTNSFKWSSCTEQNFIASLKTKVGECLLDGPHENSLTRIPLPGEMMSLDDQCLKRMGTKSFSNQPRVCTELYCYADNRTNIGGLTNGPAAEGSSCGAGSHCISGECVPRS